MSISRGLVRVRLAVTIEGALFERLGRVLVRFRYHGYPKVSDREMATLRDDEDVSGLQVAMGDVPVVEVVHARASSSTHRRATLLYRQIHVESKMIPESAFG